jgi:hypothetical protein
VVHLLDATSGKALSEPLKHDLEVVDIALNQTGSVSERKLFLIDRNRDLFITPIIRPAPFKLATVCVASGSISHAIRSVPSIPMQFELTFVCDVM